MNYSHKGKSSHNKRDDKQTPLYSSPFESMPRKSIPVSVKIQFLTFFIIQIFSFADTGLIISSSNNIISDLQIDDYKFGLIGAMPALGRALSSVIFIYLMKRINNKFFLIFGIMIKAIISVLLNFVRNYPLFLVSRFVFGLFQMYEIVFFPGWCEEHIPMNNLVLFLIQLAKPLGFVSGFYLSIITPTSIRWSTNFLFFGIFLFLFGLIFSVMPTKMFACSKTIYHKKRKFSNKTTNDTIEKGGNNVINNSSRENTINDDSQTYDEDSSSYNYNYISMDDTKSNNSFKSGNSGASKHSGNSNNSVPKSHSPFSQFIQMVKQPHYFFPTFAYSLFLFIFSPIVFHINEYMTTSLGIYNHYHIFFIFSILCLLSPLLGILSNNFINGLIFQNSRHKRLSITFTLFFIACIVGIFVPFSTTIETFIFLIWIAFTFTIYSLPSLINISIAATYYTFKLESFVLCNVSNNLLGNFLGIMLYGYINSNNKTTNNKLAMMICINLLWVVLILIGITTYFSWSLPEFKPRSKKRNKERSEGTNYLRLTRTSDVSKDVVKVSGDIVPGGRTTIIDDDDSSVDDSSRKSNDDDHAFSLNYLLQNKNNA